MTEEYKTQEAVLTWGDLVGYFDDDGYLVWGPPYPERIKETLRRMGIDDGT